MAGCASSMEFDYPGGHRLGRLSQIRMLSLERSSLYTRSSEVRRHPVSNTRRPTRRYMAHEFAKKFPSFTTIKKICQGKLI